MFDEDENEYWKTSLLILVSDEFEISYVPLVKMGMFVRLAANQAEEIMAAFTHRSEQIKDAAFLEQNYREFARKNLQYYLLRHHS